MELASIWMAMALGAIAIALVARARASRLARLVAIAAMIVCTVALARPLAKPSPLHAPRITDASGPLGSGACRACHPSEHASWSRTYHRTMTQRARPDEAPVVLKTGSHHMQGYWTEDARGALHMLPEVYAFDEKRMIPRREAFLEPENASQHDVRWSTNCIACHATAGRPNVDDDAHHTEVGELGIACEACHGAGAAHAEHERNPLTRFRRERPSIVNPARLSSERASAVCGSCHAYSFPRDEDAFLKSGYAESFRPGDALEPTRILLTPAVLASGRVSVDTDTNNLFWPDGTVRVGGREYNAMVLSACYLRGEGKKKLGCLSCHAMHASDPNDQLRRDRSVQDACISCHEMPENHTHHAQGSSGSACVACHMAKTSYALRTAIRSHRIDSPATARDRPNACNLCHLDKTITWAQTEMARLWGAAMPDVQVDVPASAIGLLMADAAERVIWADAFGDRDAIRASGADWEKPLLDAAAHDPYAVIRFIAKRSMGAYPSPTRALVARETIDTLASHRDNRDVYVAE